MQEEFCMVKKTRHCTGDCVYNEAGNTYCMVRCLLDVLFKGTDREAKLGKYHPHYDVENMLKFEKEIGVSFEGLDLEGLKKMVRFYSKHIF